MEDLAIGRRIKQRRKDLNLIHEEVIERIQGDETVSRTRETFSISHLSRIERGKSGDLKVDDLNAIARALDTNLSWLLGGDSPDLADAVQVFGPVEYLSKSVADIANYYRGALPAERSSIECIFSEIAEYVRGREADESKLRVVTALS